MAWMIWHGITWKWNLIKPQNTEKSCYICGENYQKGHNDNWKDIGKTWYKCGKVNDLSKVCRSKWKQV